MDELGHDSDQQHGRAIEHHIEGEAETTLLKSSADGPDQRAGDAAGYDALRQGRGVPARPG